MSEKNNIIECISRRYRVQAPGGPVVEVESTMPVSDELNQRLLEEDTDIDNFFKTHKIFVAGQSTFISPQKMINIGLLRNVRLHPLQRLNQIIRMKGEFTRKDYVKSLKDTFKLKLNKWTSHNDIQDALKLHKIQIVNNRSGKQRVYTVIDASEIDESAYKEFLEDKRKEQRDARALM